MALTSKPTWSVDRSKPGNGQNQIITFLGFTEHCTWRLYVYYCVFCVVCSWKHQLFSSNLIFVFAGKGSSVL